MSGFRVMAKQCQTCIYRKGFGWDVAALEAPIRDRFGEFKGHRICHYSKDVCCRGFWNRFKDKFALGRIAQRLGLVAYVKEDGEV